MIQNLPKLSCGFSLREGKLACHHHDSIALLIAARAYSHYAFIFVLFLAQIKTISNVLL